MLKADELRNIKTCIDKKWVIAKPLKRPFSMRLRDAIEVLKGKAEAVKFYKQ
ncbi:MAG: hypothetical protein ACYDG4_10750 [Desulfuromonadaceae bacterium]